MQDLIGLVWIGLCIFAFIFLSSFSFTDDDFFFHLCDDLRTGRLLTTPMCKYHYSFRQQL